MKRRSLLSFAAAGMLLVVSGCGGESPRPAATPGGNPAASGTASVSIQLNWYPEAEHGGVYQALADGTYAAAGLEVAILPGGQATPVGPDVHLGRSQFAITNADDVVLFRQQGLDVVAVMTVMQDHPRCILVHEESGVTSFEGLAGLTLQRQAGRPFLEYMRSKGLLDQVSEVPYHGSVSSLVGDPKIAIQAYSISEPFLAQQQGVKVRKLMLNELGWNPYCSVVITSGALIRNQPQVVRAFVQATRQGWTNYLTDPQAGNAAVLSANQHGMTPETLEFGSRVLKTLALPAGNDPVPFGTMTEARWQRLVEQMVQLQLVDSEKVTPADCFTTEFLGDADASTSP